MEISAPQKSKDFTALVAVCAGVLMWTIVVGRLVVARHNNFGTFDYDMGIHDQAIWGLGHGEWFNTVRGMAHLGHHGTFAYFLLVPLQWLGAGPNVWNVLQCFALASCALPIFYMAKRRTESVWIPVAIAVAWLLQPWLSWLAQETFHPEVMAMPFLFLGFYYLDPRTRKDQESGWSKTDLYGFAAFFFAMSWKEDVALAVALLGAGMWLVGRRRSGRVLFLSGVVWFVLIGAFLVPKLGDGKTVYSSLYGSLGSSSFDVMLSVFLKPSDFFNRLAENDASLYFFRLFLPFALLALLSPVFLIAMVPQFFANVLTTANFTYQPYYHYQAIPMVIIMLATLDGLWFVKQNFSQRKIDWQKIFAVLLLVVSFQGARGWGVLPGSEKYRSGVWPLAQQDTSGWEAAVKRVGKSDGVSAHYLAIPHLTHRAYAYTFPNPWLNSYFGNAPEDIGDPTKVEWILVTETGLNEQAQGVLNKLLADGEFGDKEVVNGIATYRRLKPATSE